MAFVVDQAVWDLFPGTRLVVAYGEGLDNRAERPVIRESLMEEQRRLKQSWPYQNAQSHPAVAAWREAFRRMGVSGKQFPSSIEALCRRVLAGGEVARISPLVDFYNALSLACVVPVGGWDLDGLHGQDIVLRRTVGGEPFRELGQPETTPVGAGEVAYLDAHEVITRHFVWRQSDTGKMLPATRRFFLVSEVLPEAGPDAAARVERAMLTGLQNHFGVAAQSAVLDAGERTWAWD
jgi:DNA/RNA-binding domain of Phe-tRNA-synthetase-like protein